MQSVRCQQRLPAPQPSPWLMCSSCCAAGRSSGRRPHPRHQPPAQLQRDCAATSNCLRSVAVPLSRRVAAAASQQQPQGPQEPQQPGQAGAWAQPTGGLTAAGMDAAALQQQQQQQHQQQYAAAAALPLSPGAALPNMQPPVQPRPPPAPLAWLPPRLATHLQSLGGFLRACWELRPEFVSPSLPEALRRLGLVLAVSLFMVVVVSTIDSGWLFLYLANARGSSSQAAAAA